MKNNNDILKLATAAMFGCGVAVSTAWATYDPQECARAYDGLAQCLSAYPQCNANADYQYAVCIEHCMWNGGTQEDCASGSCDSDYSFAMTMCDMDVMECEDSWMEEIDYYCC